MGRHGLSAQNTGVRRKVIQEQERRQKKFSSPLNALQSWQQLLSLALPEICCELCTVKKPEV